MTDASTTKPKKKETRGRPKIKFFLDAKYWCQQHCVQYLKVSKRTFQKFEEMGYIDRDWKRTGAWYLSDDIKAFAKSERMAVTRRWQNAWENGPHTKFDP